MNTHFSWKTALVVCLLAVLAAVWNGIRADKIQLPPELTCEVLESNNPTAVEFLVQPNDTSAIGSTSGQVYAVGQTGSAAITGDFWLYTRGGPLPPDVAEAAEDAMSCEIRSGTDLLCTQVIEQGFLLAVKLPDAELPFRVCLISWDCDPLFTLDLPAFTQEEPSICAMSLDGDTLYLFDYEAPDTIAVLAVATAGGSYETHTVTWADLAGPYSQENPPAELGPDAGHIFVLGDALYVTEQYRADNGESLLFLSAYDLAAGTLRSAHMLEGCSLVDLQVGADQLYILTSGEGRAPLELLSFDLSALEQTGTQHYALPQPWLELDGTDTLAYPVQLSCITDTQIMVLLSHAGSDGTDHQFLVMYDRVSGELEFLCRLTFSNSDYTATALWPLMSPMGEFV